MSEIHTLTDLINETKKVVVGQDQLVTDVCTVIYRHIFKVASSLANKPISGRSNLLIHGHTGCGKTFVMRTVTDILGIPMLEIDAKSLGGGGSWKGTTLTELVGDYARKVGPAFVAFIDEFDKIITPVHDSHGENWNRTIQETMLQALESRNSTVSNKYSGSDSINTEHVLYVFAGSFAEFEKRLLKKKGYTIGFNAEEKEPEFTQEEFLEQLVEFGMVPELAGRIKTVSKVLPLSEEMAIQVFERSQDLKQWSESFSYFQFPEFAISKKKRKEIISVAMRKKLGVRGLLQEIDSEINSHLLKHDAILRISDMKEMIQSLSTTHGGISAI